MTIRVVSPRMSGDHPFKTGEDDSPVITKNAASPLLRLHQLRQDALLHELLENQRRLATSPQSREERTLELLRRESSILSHLRASTSPQAEANNVMASVASFDSNAQDNLEAAMRQANLIRAVATTSALNHHALAASSLSLFPLIQQLSTSPPLPQGNFHPQPNRVSSLALQSLDEKLLMASQLASATSLAPSISHERASVAAALQQQSLLASANPVRQRSTSPLSNPSAHQRAIATTQSVAKTSSTRSAMVMYMDCDRESLSEYQCLIRQQMELFEANTEEASANVQGRNKQIVPGQVGIRCRHCAHLPPRQRPRGCMYFPSRLDRIYQAAQNLSAFHFCGDHHHSCPCVPEDVRRRIWVLRERKSPAGGGKRYWAESVRCFGVTEDGSKGGLRFGG